MSVGKELGKIGQAMVAPFANIISEAVTDKDKANELAYKLAGAIEDNDARVRLGQMEINKQEAQHRSVFVAGWRPAIGWICGIALFYHFTTLPLIEYGFWMAASIQNGWENIDFSTAPKMDLSELMTILMGMLGLTVARSVDKFNGVAQQALNPAPKPKKRRWFRRKDDE